MKFILVNIFMAICIETSQSNEIWMDNRGYSCSVYEIEFCKSGSYGPNWRFDVEGLFRDYADVNGFDASDRCCECIPSSSITFTHLGCSPRVEEHDMPENDRIWVDAVGHPCQFYREPGWCKYFGYGRNSIA